MRKNVPEFAKKYVKIQTDLKKLINDHQHEIPHRHILVAKTSLNHSKHLMHRC